MQRFLGVTIRLFLVLAPCQLFGQAVIGHALDQPVVVEQQDAAAEVKKTLDELIVVVETYSGEQRTSERRSKLREIINPRFDFEEMAKRSLGPLWLEIAPTDQAEFVAIFSDLLSTTYLSRIETVNRETVKVEKQVGTPPKLVVKTTVQHKGSVFPIDYKVAHDGSKWRVYDVIIENIGLVSNYRNEFTSIIRKEKFEGLMARLREKAAKRP